MEGNPFLVILDSENDENASIPIKTNFFTLKQLSRWLRTLGFPLVFARLMWKLGAFTNDKYAKSMVKP